MNRTQVLKEYIHSTDWVDCKLMDLIIEAIVEEKTTEDIKQIILDHYDKYSDAYTDRKQTREKIDLLESDNFLESEI